jgi:hypothetical protein
MAIRAVYGISRYGGIFSVEGALNVTHPLSRRNMESTSHAIQNCSFHFLGVTAIISSKEQSQRDQAYSHQKDCEHDN